MNAIEIYQVIDDPQEQYKHYKVAECFAELAQDDDEKSPEYQLESIAFTFYLDDKASVAGISTAGIKIASTPAAKAYFQQRLSLTKHPETLTRYGHLLWQLYRYFPGYQVAIGAYLQLAEYALDRLGNNDKYFLRWSRTIYPALILSAATKDQQSFDKAVGLTNHLLSLPVPLWMKGRTLDEVIKNLKGKARMLDLDIYVQEALQQTGNGGYTLYKENYETAIKADMLMGANRQALLWEQMGDGIRSHALSRTNDPARIVILPQLAEAMECYKKAKAEDKFRDTAIEYQSFKKTRKVSRVLVNLIDGDKGRLLYDYIEARKQEYLTMPVDDILVNLATDLTLLPWDGGENEKGPYDQLTRQLTLVNFDINQNPKVLSAAGSERFSKAWTYKMKYKIFSQQYISEIMHELINKGELSISVLDAFFEKTWIGKTTLTTSSGNTDEEYQLYAAIRPALLYYLEQAERSLRSEEADFVLCTDTLVLKYEMLIRFFLQNCGVATTAIDSASGEPRENYLPELLDKLPQDRFDEKDKLLMRHIYTKNGMDLRNNIAHSYLAPKSYTLELADTVVWSIIRLGQYTATDQASADL
ncbi:DUF4209 domain-containing protein [Mucilaginibacter sp. OK283]|uniref:DUF4209 domain-containing protein n=1 Tax=Mucilaginibacter sp. OK283 TaxID=1881049 RepID=UPI0008D66CA1|nr:DUF4209 domain-containing protein [Mucilaginibacter sp. OK283]SEO59244.1 protein of unknown function [Mucilaginibacter sp. OK283]